MEGKNHDHVNRYRKNIWQMLMIMKVMKSKLFIESNESKLESKLKVMKVNSTNLEYSRTSSTS